MTAQNEEKRSLLDELVAEARRIEEDSLYSAKSHFEAEQIESALHYRIGIPSTLAAALAGASVVGDAKMIAVALATIAAVTAALLTFMDPKARAAEHHGAGSRYLSLRNRARAFVAIDMKLEKTPELMASELKRLADERDGLNSSSPAIPRRAFERARKGIEAGEARYAVD